MKIKILKGEWLYSKQGTHICDENGIAKVATEDTECEVSERVEIVLELVKQHRASQGLDAQGNSLVDKLAPLDTAVSG